MKKKVLYVFPVLIGICFCFYYLHLAADNVAYSDYIRLINSYLPDVGNPAKFFVPDILTRVPITYLGRLINVRWLGYNTLFDMALGVLSLGLGAAALAVYAGGPGRERGRAPVSYFWYLCVLAVYFGLNKWEMLANGTGWVCFLSISGFYCHYVVLDRAVREGHRSRRDRWTLLLLPSVLTLLVAGPYCGSYCAILLLAYLTLLLWDYRRNRRVNGLYAAYLLSVLLPLGLYLWSNSAAVYVHRGAVEGSLIRTFFQNPGFFAAFLLKAFASAALGIAQIQDLAGKGGLFGSEWSVYVLGAFVAVLYLGALYLNWRHQIWRETALPLLLILNGGLNHLLILAARWIFLNSEYGMSSRYELQYQMGLAGILLTFGICWERYRRRIAERGRRSLGGASLWLAFLSLGTAVILSGSLYTTREELKTAPFRKAYLQISRDLGLNYRTASDEDLETYLHHDAEEIRRAMRILEENNLNIFRD